jgi:SAM-dependent methyltransferase
MGAGGYSGIISDKANELLKSREHIKLLEAGCGSSSYFDFQRVEKAVGIDIDQTQLDANKVLHEKLLGDLQTYPLPAGEFDIVVCWDVVEHLPRPQEALANMFRTLRPGGLLVLGFPHLLSFKGLVTKYSPFWFHEAFYRYMKYTTRHFPTYLRTAIMPKRVIRQAEESGLSVVFFQLSEGGVSKKFRKKFAVVDIGFKVMDGVWRVATLGKCESLSLDSCALVFQKTGAAKKSA